MFNNYAMYDEDIIESAEQVSAGELVLSLENLDFLLKKTVDLSTRQKLENKMIFGVFRKMLETADLDDEEEMKYIFEAAARIQQSDIENPLYVLDILAERGVSFTEIRYYSGSQTTLRDWILERICRLGIVERLSQLGVDLNTPLIKGKTPAFIVANRELQKRIPFTKIEPEEEMAKAVSYFSKESMEALNADGTSAAHIAVKNNHYLMLEAMIQAGVDVNLTEDSPRVAGTTLLHTACRYGYSEIVKLLIEAGADDTILNVKEESPAHTVLFHDYVTGSKKLTIEDRIALLRELKHVDVPGKCGRTPMMAAMDSGDYGLEHNLTPVFLEKGADVNHADIIGDTPLLLCGGMDLVKALVKAGADVNARNQDGNTPLHKALMRRSSEEAQYLIKKGADINVANEERVTPVQLAVEQGLDELFPLLGL
ncbi:MAG: ankyrin repeat domain-containing protein [Acetatifactor sp.]|nr:ankyrin repeat domain-containing protein [Acetatifactor sp.]